jgi:hypothetical protein
MPLDVIRKTIEGDANLAYRRWHVSTTDELGNEPAPRLSEGWVVEPVALNRESRQFGLSR